MIWIYVQVSRFSATIGSEGVAASDGVNTTAERLTSQPDKEIDMADKDDTRVPTSLEQAIEAERGKLLEANAALKCLYQVLLYEEGEDAVTHAEAAHLVAALVDESVARLVSVQLNPLIDELTDLSELELEDIRVAFVS